MSSEVRFEEYAHGSAAYAGAVGLRQDVLRTPLGLRFTDEELAEESLQRHFGAFAEDRLIGTLSFEFQGAGLWKMRQAAIHPEWRGRSVGAALVRHAEAALGAEGAKEIVLHARADVTGFYETLGYRIEGDPFTEVTISHRLMRKVLPGPFAPCA